MKRATKSKKIIDVEAGTLEYKDQKFSLQGLPTKALAGLALDGAAALIKKHGDDENTLLRIKSGQFWEKEKSIEELKKQIDLNAGTLQYGNYHFSVVGLSSKAIIGLALEGSGALLMKHGDDVAIWEKIKTGEYWEKEKSLEELKNENKILKDGILGLENSGTIVLEDYRNSAAYQKVQEENEQYKQMILNLKNSGSIIVKDYKNNEAYLKLLSEINKFSQPEPSRPNIWRTLGQWVRQHSQDRGR